MSHRPIPRIAKIGEKLAPSLTVLGVIDGGSDEPMYIVWNHDDWCPMACKMMRTFERAEREAGVVRAMSHPFIVRVLGTMKPQFLLMPFLEGPSLADLIHNDKGKTFAVSDALRVAIHIGSALKHVHGRGYVHHDVKPDNVIVTPGGRPMLFDFGSARKFGTPRPKHVTGTDAYISPEEALLGDPGPPADVFALGVILYEMLSGAMPFPKGTKANPFPQVSAKPTPLRSRRKSVPRRVEDVVHACLAKEAAERPELKDLIVGLNALITSGPRMWPDGFEP
jgi:serine/threonine-protein kinase